jgi:(1->4)-alpha-D-glucan 1-alpha-D-glucosylmutase
MPTPSATYRIQLTPAFGFQKLRAQLDYLRDLGVSHVYASPIFGARPGSTHGYDVVAPDRMNLELGSPKDLDEVLLAARENGLGWLQDIVPNHMAFDHHNTMLMDALEYGEASPYYRMFDVEWDHPYENMHGRLLAPFLGQFFGDCLEQGEIRLEFGPTGFFVRYYDLHLPVAPSSYAGILARRLSILEDHLAATDPAQKDLLEIIQGFRSLPPTTREREYRDQVEYLKHRLEALVASSEGMRAYLGIALETFNGERGNPDSYAPLDELLTEQRYRLAFWKVATEEINYRRFFNINQLISVRVEEEQVFRATHSFVLRLLWQNLIDGIRVDHVDGLYDPGAYLHRLREVAPEAYIVVEKILDPEEDLSPLWPVHGTTGYDFLNVVNGILCDRKNDQALEKAYFRFIGKIVPYDAMVAEKKRLFLGRHMAGDIDRLALRLRGISARYRHARDITLYGLRRALVELLTFFPVYRTYVSGSTFQERDRQYIELAVRRAIESAPALTLELRFIERFLCLEFDPNATGDERTEMIDFVMRFQQMSGPLMAKGLEDTALYVYAKLLSLNDVGGNARKVGVSPVEFHFFNKRRALQWPDTLNATATHDTKRGEDMRARISVLSEIPREWQQHVIQWKRANRVLKPRMGREFVPDDNDEYFLYQTLLGSFPFDGIVRGEYVRRIKDYAVKAVREAKVHTAWLRPDESYEQGYLTFIERILDTNRENSFLRDFLPFHRRIVWYGMFNSLSQVTLKATCPGIPDFYQGTELWDLSLVDPDNRHEVDYGRRRSMLAELTAREGEDPFALLHELLMNLQDGRAKLYLIQKLLAARKTWPGAFQRGEYVPLGVHGQHRNSVLAFARQAPESMVAVVVPRLLTNVVVEGVTPTGMQVWGDTCVEVPTEGNHPWQHAITGGHINAARMVAVGELLQHFPVAVLAQTAT